MDRRLPVPVWVAAARAAGVCLSQAVGFRLQAGGHGVVAAEGSELAGRWRDALVAVCVVQVPVFFTDACSPLHCLPSPTPVPNLHPRFTSLSSSS